MRLQHELKKHDGKGMFITLSYDDKHLPLFGSLIKSHLQKFFKRFRKEIAPVKIKYYACGEYGSRQSEEYYQAKYNRAFGRPHYHAILLGVSNLSDSHCESVMYSWPFCDWNEIIKDQGSEKVFGTVTQDSIRYVADYIFKKYSNKDTHKMYKRYGYCNPEFQLVSQGIGKDYLQDDKERIKETGKVHYRGKAVSLPRYYLDKIDLSEEVRAKLKFEATSKNCKKYGIDIFQNLLYGLERFPTEKQYSDSRQREINFKAHAALRNKGEIDE